MLGDDGMQSFAEVIENELPSGRANNNCISIGMNVN